MGSPECLDQRQFLRYAGGTMPEALQSALQGASLLFTCEHAENRIPREYAGHFAGARALLQSHRGWDPGAAALARHLAAVLQAPLLATPWSRLLVEANRSEGNPQLWSRFTRDLPAEERAHILATYWQPHRDDVVAAVEEGVRRRGRIVHIAVHSFVDILDGVRRNADVGLLYDPARRTERELCVRWEQRLKRMDPALRVRRNYPYRGLSDGLTTWLRRRHGDKVYAGLELEVNQSLLAGPRRRRVHSTLAESLGATLV
jgi:predicted N-formylglutamate amidohydrolase